ncbi:eae-like domain protein [Cronobacter malonaticus]
MHSENNELVRAGHELAKCLDNEPLLDIAKLLSKMATQLDVTTAALREKTKQCEQLAAENAALKAICDDRRTFIMNGVQMGYIKVPTVETDPALETIRIAVSPQEKTPATDAFLREVRAQAITSALDSLDGVFDTDCVMETNGISYEKAEQRTTGALAVNSALIEFAAELRQGGAA